MRFVYFWLFSLGEGAKGVPRAARNQKVLKGGVFICAVPLLEGEAFACGCSEYSAHLSRWNFRLRGLFSQSKNDYFFLLC